MIALLQQSLVRVKLLKLHVAIEELGMAADAGYIGPRFARYRRKHLQLWCARIEKEAKERGVL